MKKETEGCINILMRHPFPSETCIPIMDGIKMKNFKTMKAASDFVDFNFSEGLLIPIFIDNEISECLDCDGELQNPNSLYK